MQEETQQILYHLFWNFADSSHY